MGGDALDGILETPGIDGIFLDCGQSAARARAAGRAAEEALVATLTTAMGKLDPSKLDLPAYERETPPQLDHEQCHFGSWMRGQGLGSHGTHPSFDTIDGLHRAAHGLAAELCAQKALHQDDLALARLGELQALGEDLLRRVKELELSRSR